MVNVSSVEAGILLAKLNALMANVPSISDFAVGSRVHNEWIGKIQAVVNRADPSLDFYFNSAASRTNYSLISSQREGWGEIFRIVSRLTTNLELRTTINGEAAGKRDQVFGPGAVYDFFKALSDIVESATKTLLIVDPYMDDKIFDTYLSSSKRIVSARLLANNYAANVRAAADAFKMQHSMSINVRKTSKLHDRLIFVDDLECWTLGQSIKDAAAQKPTYLAPLSADVAQLKLTYYEDIWSYASPL